MVRDAGVSRCFIVAGDPPEPEGPYFDTMALIRTGAFERAGIRAIGVGGHPEGHPNMTAAEAWAVLEAKLGEIDRRGMAGLMVTQFGFDPGAILAWLKEAGKVRLHFYPFGGMVKTFEWPRLSRGGRPTALAARRPARRRGTRVHLSRRGPRPALARRRGAGTAQRGSPTPRRQRHSSASHHPNLR